MSALPLAESSSCKGPLPLQYPNSIVVEATDHDELNRSIAHLQLGAQEVENVTQKASSSDSRIPCNNSPAFHRFSDLPKELRLTIWQLALPRKRVLEVKTIKLPSGAPKEWRQSCKPFGIPNSAPILLHVCSESRQEALMFYHLVFGTSWLSAGTAYIDPQFDTLFFRHENMTVMTFLMFYDYCNGTSLITSIALCTRACRFLCRIGREEQGESDWLSDMIGRVREKITGSLRSAVCSNVAEGIIDGDLRLDSCTCEAEEEHLGLRWLSKDDIGSLKKHFFGVELVRAPLADPLAPPKRPEWMNW